MINHILDQINATQKVLETVITYRKERLLHICLQPETDLFMKNSNETLQIRKQKRKKVLNLK